MLVCTRLQLLALLAKFLGVELLLVEAPPTANTIHSIHLIQDVVFADWYSTRLLSWGIFSVLLLSGRAAGVVLLFHLKAYIVLMFELEIIKLIYNLTIQYYYILNCLLIKIIA